MANSRQHPVAKLAEDRLKAHAKRFLPDAQVWLFGSRATAKALRRSDFDLAVLMGSETPESALTDFTETIKADPEIIYPVDIVDLRTATPSLRNEIQRNGILWTN